ncbi:MAG: NUDIX hydrolase [Actinomycetota bacterium]
MFPDGPDGLAHLAVDLVTLTVRDDRLQVLLVKRGVAPFKGRWALPGGFVLEGESLTAAAVRELAEEAGLRKIDAHLEQLATYAAPDRDPRGRVVSVAHLVLAPDLPAPTAGSDASGACWADASEMAAVRRKLAFDHHQILIDGIERARSKLEYTPLATAFCPLEFTIRDLRRVYEAVWDVELDPRNFHRKITSTPGFVEPTGQTALGEGGRPAALFRKGSAQLLHPAMLRPEF